ncbi:MAG: hypothetical protein HYY62_06160 [Deltaproteobacteria bacterium]|nr:hypothetical protein [Deltaproteobacteria bacterium]
MSITKQDLNQLSANIKKDFREELKGAETRLQKEMQGMETRLKQEIKEKVDDGVDILRILTEELRKDLKFAFEARDPHEEKLQKHDQKLENHETRLTTLEDYTYTKDRLR